MVPQRSLKQQSAAQDLQHCRFQGSLSAASRVQYMYLWFFKKKKICTYGMQLKGLFYSPMNNTFRLTVSGYKTFKVATGFKSWKCKWQSWNGCLCGAASFCVPCYKLLLLVRQLIGWRVVSLTPGMLPALWSWWRNSSALNNCVFAWQVWFQLFRNVGLQVVSSSLVVGQATMQRFQLSSYLGCLVYLENSIL